MERDNVSNASGARRVLIVSNLFPPHVVGGAEVVAHRQAVELQARGYSISVFSGWLAPPGVEGRLETEYTDGMRIWRAPVVSFEPDDNFFSPTLAARLQSIMEVEQPNLVHFHNVAGFGFSLIPVVKQFGVPVIVTLHDHAGYCYRATALRPDGRHCSDSEQCGVACRGSVQPGGTKVALPMRLRRDYVAWTLAQADRLISPSAAMAAAYCAAGAVDPNRLKVISNGIDLDQFDSCDKRQSNPEVRFACIAYLGEHKGIKDLLEAAALLAANHAFAGLWSLVIAGDGELRPQVEAEIASGRVGPTVTFLGRVAHSEIVSAMAATDVLVLPSRWPENEPVVLLEAIAAGVAQLATAVGGMPDLIEAGVTGELVPPADPAALAKAMADYIREPERARRQGEANLARRHLFSQDAAVTEIEAIYDAALQKTLPKGQQRPLVLCAGDWPLVQVAEMCNGLHHLEKGSLGIRLVWHEWANPDAWQQAALLWNWSAGADHGAIQRALRTGVPVLAPSSCMIGAGVADTFGAAFTYDTFLEGMIALARLPHDTAAQRSLRRNCRVSAALLDASTPSARYYLPTPAISA